MNPLLILMTACLLSGCAAAPVHYINELQYPYVDCNKETAGMAYRNSTCVLLRANDPIINGTYRWEWDGDPIDHNWGKSWP